MSGFVSLVGGGPGDPGLLTLAGRDRLELCDVVVYDRLIDPALLDFAPETAERIFAGKSPESKALSQDEINALLVEKGLAGKQVVRLKGGDPFVFGRGGEEALALAAAGVPFEVIPGITSAIAAPAYAGVPVTHRGLASSFAVVTGHEDEDKPDASVDWRRMATAVDTIVVLMGAAALSGVSRELVEGGRAPETPAVSIEWGTTTRQRSVTATLETLPDAVRGAGLRNPLLTVIGDVASLREHIGWFESRPLFGKRVLVTRTRSQASTLSDLLRREGAQPVELPALELQPVATDDDLEAMSRSLETREYDWCLFTSTQRRRVCDGLPGALEARRSGFRRLQARSARLGDPGGAGREGTARRPRGVRVHLGRRRRGDAARYRWPARADPARGGWRRHRHGAASGQGRDRPQRHAVPLRRAVVP